MKYWEQLSAFAVLGTARESGSPLPPEALSALLADDPSITPEAAVLRAAAATALYWRAGQRPARPGVARAVCPADPRPACSTNAIALLNRALADSEPELLLGWLTACAKSGRRIPRAALPQLLDLAVRPGRDKRIPGALIAAGGVALGWLADQNADWAAMSGGSAAALAATDADSADVAVFQTGAKAQRGEALSRLRARNATLARETLAASMAQEAAADRATFVESLAANLSPDDEAFLQSCLADRSQKVRDAAADLLARLPASGYVARLQERVKALVGHFPVVPGGLLKRPRGIILEIALPAECDDAMKADGIDPKPPQGTGQKQWWLSQMLRRVSPAWWRATYGLTAEQMLSGIVKENRPMLQQAMTEATFLHADSEWAFALSAMSEDLNLLRQVVVPALTPAQYQQLIRELCEGRKSEDKIITVVHCRDDDLDEATARAVVTRLSSVARAGGMGYYVGDTLGSLATRVPPSLVGEIERALQFDDKADNYWQTLKQKILNTMSLRLEIQKEFAS